MIILQDVQYNRSSFYEIFFSAQGFLYSLIQKVEGSKSITKY